MSDRHVDYASAYFPFREPTKIVGEPSYRTLTQLRKELHANASSVDSELGGGNQGYLGLATHDANYPGATAFVAPGYPADLTIPDIYSNMQAMNLREQHKEKIRKHRECSNVEKSLQRHIQKAVDQKYIDHYVDDETDLLVGDIPDILDDLFDNTSKLEEMIPKIKKLKCFVLLSPLQIHYLSFGTQLNVFASLLKKHKTPIQMCRKSILVCN